MRLLIIFISFIATVNANAQIQWEELSPMPERVTNNAVTAATVNAVLYVYSFSGLDSTKACGNNHLRSFRYNTETDIWETIAPLPDDLGGKIAAGASTIKNKIYIIGGYHVSNSCGEISSAKTHIYDPEANAYLADGAPIPVAIDDQVQDVWRDSLLYVVTGWSNNTNVVDVQIYNPSTDEWLEGTPIPNSADWRVFGGAGMIIGDTIYYIGGATYTCTFANCFPPTTFFRRGIINPNNPTEITWEGSENPAAQGYRMGATTFNGKGVWIGGSDITYNFDGIDYNGSGGVAPLGRVTFLDPANDALMQFSNQIPKIMDLRGVAKISENEVIICGGMEEGQSVTNKVFKITLDDLTNVRNPVIDVRHVVYPNPANAYVEIYLEGVFDLQIIDINGRGVVNQRIRGGERVDVSHLQRGIYFLYLRERGEIVGFEKLVKQ